MSERITICIENNKIIGLSIGDLFLKLKKPLDLSMASEIIETARKFLTYFDVSEIAKEIPTEVMLSYSVKEFLRHYKSRDTELKLLKALIVRDKLSKEELIEATGINEKAKEAKVNPGRFLAGVLAGITKIAERYGLEGLIRKDEEEKYYIREDIKPIIRREIFKI